MKRFVLIVATLAACSDTTQNAPTQLNLDRPVDIAFACYGGLRLTGGGAATPEQEVISSAQPIESCNIRSGVRTGNLPPPPPGQEDLTSVGGSNVATPFYYGFVLQSGPGTVAVSRFETKPQYSPNDVAVLDADSLTPGKNSITVGEDPVAIVTDRAGCYGVVANAGSCDLSLLEVNSAVRESLGQGDVPGQDPIVNRLVVRNGSGQPILARPAAMVAEPQTGTIGNACAAPGEAPQTGAQGLVYIAYPSCHLVAGVDVSSGTIVTGVSFDANGVPTVIDGATVTCPSECDGTGGVTPGFRPIALDLEVDARSQRRVLAIGADNSPLLTFYELDQAFRPQTVFQVPLENTNGRLGLSALAISPLIGIGGSENILNDETSPSGDHQFIYAVANDGSVRVVDIQGTPRECDTQIDPRFIREVRDPDALACFTVGAVAGPPRRAGVRGPGIELVGDIIPTSVDFFTVSDIEPVDLMMDKRADGPDRLTGHFAMVSASDGRTFIVNVDDDGYADFVTNVNPIGTAIPLVAAHQLRDDISDRGRLAQRESQFVCDDPGPEPETTGGAGGARLLGPIARNVPSGTLAAEKTGGLPSIRQVFCDAQAADEEDRPVSELFFSAPLAVRDEVFPDLRALRNDETWSLTWEGSLSLDTGTTAVDGPPVRDGQMFVDGAGMRMVDQSRPYCEAGVEPYDILQMRGCDPSLGDAGCTLGYTCYVHPQSQVAGLGSCMLIDEAERLANACRPFLTSLRRYTVGRTKSGELQLIPRKHVLRTTPTTGCTDDAQCVSLARYALSNASSANPVDDKTPDDTRTWSCQVDPDRRPEQDPMGQPLKRCIMTCNDLEASSDCAIGTVCTAHPDAAPRMGFCMEGVTPPQACVNAPQRYELRAGDAFAFVGSRTGFQHPIIADAGGNCVRDPDANPYLVSRIPLKAPACDPAANPLTGQRPDGTFDPNPCQTVVDETEYQLNYVAGTCTLGNPDESIVTRDATALRLRHRALTLTLVDPTYQGDLRCHGDRQGMLQDVPLVSPGYQIAFRQTAGFTPKSLRGVAASFPVKVTRGPGQSIWVIDEGDFLSTSIAQASTRGKVYRVESRALNVISVLE